MRDCKNSEDSLHSSLLTMAESDMGGMPIIAVDTGGTFTDFFLLDPSGIRIHKVLSTPHDPSEAIRRGLKELGFDRGEIVHGSTVATNALLERKGARVALVTTAGFEDVIEIARQNRSELYNLFVERTPPLVPRRDRYGVLERVAANGKVLSPLQKSPLTRLVRRLRRKRVESIAISLLHSYANDKHEREIADAMQGLKIPLSLSSHLCPEFREFERTVTTCVNAYVAPLMSRYLKRLQRRVSQPIRVMQSNGGSLFIDEASGEPVRTLLSGPAGGALGALRVGKRSGFEKILAFDMGGTSSDLTLIDRKFELTREGALGSYPIITPRIGIHTIGAGGGSIARVDAGGALQVGPESAGAFPGPICYGRNGRGVTITDAHLWLGRIDPEHFLGGTMPLYPERIERPLQRLADSLKLSLHETADGIIQVANASMARALRAISLERGHDPRQFTLVAFGGAGGLHACELAEALEIPRVMIPENPGILSAFGMAYADWVRDYVKTLLLPQHRATWRRLQRELQRLKRRSLQDARREHLPPHRISFQAELDLRYAGQSYELRVPFTKEYPRSFRKAHRTRFGYLHRGHPIEVVHIRLQARVALHHPKDPPSRDSQKERRSSFVPLKRSRLFFGGRFWEVDRYERGAFSPGDRIQGPAVVTEYSGTTFLPPGWQLRCDEHKNLILMRRR